MQHLPSTPIRKRDWPEARELCRLHQDWELSASVWQRERHLGTLPLADVLRETEAALDDLLTRFETRSTSHAIPARSLGMSRAIATSPRSPFRTTSASQGSPFPCRAGTAEKFPAVRQEFSTTPLHAPFELPRACFPSQNSQSGSSPLARSRSTSPESSAMTTVGTVSSIAD
eukprot:g68797.t1